MNIRPFQSTSKYQSRIQRLEKEVGTQNGEVAKLSLELQKKAADELAVSAEAEGLAKVRKAL